MTVYTVPVLGLSEEEKHWGCPDCGLIHITKDPAIQLAFHTCKAHPELNGRKVPFIRIREKNKQEVKKSEGRQVLLPRQDFIGTEKGVDGIMGVSTERADGSNDLTLFLPTIRVTRKDLS